MSSQFNPARGRDSLYAWGLEKQALGIRQGTLRYMKPDSFDSHPDYGWNKGSSVIAPLGDPKGTPGAIKAPGKPKMDATVWRFATAVSSVLGAPASIAVVTAAHSWRAIWYPRSLSNADLRAITEYAYFGNSDVGAQIISGRMASKVGLGMKAQDRIKMDVDFTNSFLGANHIGFAVAKTGNSGTFAGQWSFRGVRQQDSNYLAAKSVFLKVHSIVGSIVNFYTKVDTATDGSGDFSAATGSYGTAIVALKVQDPSIDFDGFVQVVDDTGANMGNFGEDFNPLMVAINTVTGFAVGDEFEFPYEMEALSPTYVNETRFSTFHVNAVVGSRTIKFDNATGELDFGVKPWEANLSRYPAYVDRSGSVMFTFKETSRLYDSFIRNLQETNGTTGLYLGCQDGALIPSAAEHEGFEVWLSQARVQGATERQVTTRDVLTSAPTFGAEEPDTATVCPFAAYLPGSHAVEIACTFKESPLSFF